MTGVITSLVDDLRQPRCRAEQLASGAGSGTSKSMNFPTGPNYVCATTGATHACANFPNTAMMCIGLAVDVNRVRPAVR